MITVGIKDHEVAVMNQVLCHEREAIFLRHTGTEVALDVWVRLGMVGRTYRRGLHRGACKGKS